MNVSKNAIYSWSAPLMNTDGTSLTDLALFTIKLGNTAGVYTSEAKGISGTLSSESLLAVFPGLISGTYFAVITAVNSVGSESSPSNEISFTLIQETPSAPVSFTITG
jgi:hypothetical protein